MDEIQDTLKDGLNAQGVYVYQPGSKPEKAHGERPSKRRKVKAKDEDQRDEISPFVPLLDGHEALESVQLRYNTYKTLWSEQERKIQEILDDVDSQVLENVLSFVKTTSEVYDGCIPTALVTVGSNVSSLSRLLSRLNSHLTSLEQGGVVVLESGDAPNLKTALKNIIRGAITNTEGNEGYQELLTDRAGPRLLAYDLDLLSDYVERKRVKKLVLALRDSEAFDLGVLTDLLSLLSAWLDRIPFTLLFGISTSVELFEGRLPRSSAALLRGAQFEIHDAGDCVDRIYEAVQGENNSKLWLGHPAANWPQDKLCEATRNLPSFRSFCENLLYDGHSKQVRALLEDDKFLLQQTRKHLEIGQRKLKAIFEAIRVIRIGLRNLKLSKRTNVGDLSVDALSGDLYNSPILKDLLMAVKALDAKSLEDFLTVLPGNLLEDPEFEAMQEDLRTLTQAYHGAEPLRSKYDSLYSTVGTTVVRQRVKLYTGKVRVPEEVTEYTTIVERLCDRADAYFAETLIKPQDLFLHEVFLFDLRSPLKDAFTPRPRFAVERALSSPFDYLVSTSQAVRLSAQQPTTAILYQLYLDSGALVNVYDLWQTFHSVFENVEGDDCNERLTMTLFYRALSELKTLGIVKSSRKKADHVAKSAWLGL
ncbi:hypothetical protein MPDQ_004091 [Monascus purpureus]|uniref:Uncharacterized protein n=1 Tax=Monascus purpureus TaxID=5098 RepID=A0A507R1M9_MONPU|nr:hypothetical protein MPDQ_004091 [Monascus purpureus]